MKPDWEFLFVYRNYTMHFYHHNKETPKPLKKASIVNMHNNNSPDSSKFGGNSKILMIIPDII